MPLDRTRPPRAVWLALAASLTLAACAAAGGNAPVATRATAKPTGTRPAKTPLPSLSSNPTTAGTARPSEAVAALARQVQDLAAIEHTRAAAGVLANNAAGVVSNNGGTLLSNNAAGLLANNSAGIVSNNAGGIIANNTAGYALLDAIPAFSATPEDGEDDGQAFDLPDGTRGVAFSKADGSQRVVVTNKDGKQLEQQRITGSVYEGDVRTAAHTERTLVYGNDHRSRGFLSYDETYDAQGRLLTLEHQPSTLEEPLSKLKIVVKKLEFTVEPASGSFEIAFEHLGAVETGTIDQVVRDIAGKGVGIDLADPLAAMGGTSVFKTTAGKQLFERRTRVAAGQPTTMEMKLQDGWSLALTRTSRTAPWQGDLLRDGKKAGTAALTRFGDAGVTYRVRPDGADDIYVSFPEQD